MAMDDILATFVIGNGRSVHVGALARGTLVDSGAEHMGHLGYFLFEASDMPGERGISVLGKAASFDAAMRLIDLLRLR
jgi:hypothetical protein